MRFFHRCCGSRFRALILFSALASGSVWAQMDYSTEGISGVVASADQMLQAGDYEGAIPALEEVIRRTIDLTDPKGVETLQNCRYQLGLAMFQTGRVSGGMEILEEYLQTEPRNQEPMALRMMAQGYLESQEWEKVEETVIKLMDQPHLQKEDLLIGNLLLGQALFRQEKWVDSVKPLTYAAEKSNDEHIKRVSGIMVVRAMVGAGNWDELFTWIPRLYRTDAKYDITLNLTLMNAGKAQFERASDEDEAEDITKAYLNSLLLYRMVLPREDLIGFANTQLEGLLKKLTTAETSGVNESAIEQLEKEISDLKASVTVLKELPPYEDEVAFRVGQIYADVKRYWEGYVIFENLYANDSASTIGEASMLQSVLVLYDAGEEDRGDARVIQYLDERPDGIYARLLLSMMVRNNLVKKNFDTVIGLLGYLGAMSSPPNQEEKNLVADINYMGAFGYFQKWEYALAAQMFTIILDDFQNSPHFSNALYFRGLSYMMTGKYEFALADFREYQNKNSQGEHYAVSMFREAVCLFGLERSAESEVIFSRFIDAYPNDELISEAYSMRGDIESAKEASRDDPYTLDRALVDYRQAIDKASDPLQASYPAFQAAKVFKLESKWQEIIDLMNYYLDRWEDIADVAEAVYWIGQSQIELGEVPEAVAAYIESIERFGNDTSKQGVDKIIVELVKVSKFNMSEEDREGLAVKLKLKQTAIDYEKDAVLRLRLQVLQSLLQGEDIAAALGSELLESQQDLKVATPVSLALMCDAAVASSDTEQMQRLSDYFIETYEESDLLWHAYRAKTSKLKEEGDLQAVLDSVEDAQGLFGAESYMGWAQLTKASTLFKMKEYDEAEDAYNMVMGVSEWRGPVFAEAMYGMGMCRMAKGDLETAHTFFQRTYLLFKSYADGDWAAKGYLAAADSLIKMDRRDDAIKTLQEMLIDDYTKTNPMAEKVRGLLRKMGVQ